MPRITEMTGVRELTEGYAVELWRNEQTGRLVVRAKNEGGNNVTEVDLWDLIRWFSTGPPPEEVNYGTAIERDREGS
jgi:hypothetical protein